MNKIKIDIKSIRNNLINISGHIQLVLKSNAYGFGNSIISYIDDLISSIATTDYNEYLNIREKVRRNTPILLLYEDDMKLLDEDSNIFMCINNLKVMDKISNYERCYVRFDPYLGLHGIDEFKEITRLCSFNRILLHINEFLDPVEYQIYCSILHYVRENNFYMSIGGSAVLNIIDNIYKTDLIEMRLARRVMFKNENSSLSNFVLEVQVISQKILNGEAVSIGYKSSRIEIDRGTII